MMEQDQVAIVEAHPFGTHLDAVRATLNGIIKKPTDLDTVSHEGECKLQLISNCSDKSL